MSTKIRAVLMRKWGKTDKSRKTLATVKGRDYYDLLWYLEKGIIPNYKCIESINNKEQLKKNYFQRLQKLILEVFKLTLNL